MKSGSGPEMIYNGVYGGIVDLEVESRWSSSGIVVVTVAHTLPVCHQSTVQSI